MYGYNCGWVCCIQCSYLNGELETPDKAHTLGKKNIIKKSLKFLFVIFFFKFLNSLLSAKNLEGQGMCAMRDCETNTFMKIFHVKLNYTFCCNFVKITSKSINVMETMKCILSSFSLSIAFVCHLSLF